MPQVVDPHVGKTRPRPDGLPVVVETREAGEEVTVAAKPASRAVKVQP